MSIKTHEQVPLIGSIPQMVEQCVTKAAEVIGKLNEYNKSKPTIKMIAPKIELLGDKILVLADPPEKITKGGIALHEDHIKKQVRGTVAATGPGKRVIDPNTNLAVDMGMKTTVGDRVVFAPQGTGDFQLDGVTYVLMNEEYNVIGILPPEAK